MLIIMHLQINVLKNLIYTCISNYKHYLPNSVDVAGPCLFPVEGGIVEVVGIVEVNGITTEVI